MPLNPDLKSKLESPIADLKNYAGVCGVTQLRAPAAAVQA